MKDFGLEKVNDEKIYVNEVFYYKNLVRKALEEIFDSNHIKTKSIPEIFALQMASLYTVIVENVIKYERIYFTEHILDDIINNMKEYYKAFKGKF